MAGSGAGDGGVSEPLTPRLPGESPCAFVHGDDGWMACATHGWTGPREQRSRVLVCPDAAIEPRMAEAYRETIRRHEVRRMNVDPDLRKRVEQIKSSPVQLYREAGDYSNRELVEGILVTPDDIAAIEAVARDTFLTCSSCGDPETPRDATILCLSCAQGVEWAENAAAAQQRMVQPDHYQRWER